MADPGRRPPLSHREPIEAGAGVLAIAEHPFVTRHILRAAPAAAAAPVREALGLALPVKPLSVVSKGATAILWLGPDEWMIVGGADAGGGPLAVLGKALAGAHHQLVEVSDAYTAIEVSGAKARAAMMKLTTLDLDARAFKARQVAGSLFGRANAWLWLERDTKADGPRFHLIVRASLADYLWCVLAEAGREWGMPEEKPVSGETLLQATAQSLP